MPREPNWIASWTATILVGWAEIQVTRTLVAHNDVQFATTGSNHMGSILWSCCDLYDNTGDDYTAPWWGFGNGNFSADPLVCDADAGDFTLHSDSPCLPGNHPDGAACGLIGALDVGCGPSTSVEQTSWGAVKEMFR